MSGSTTQSRWSPDWRAAMVGPSTGLAAFCPLVSENASRYCTPASPFIWTGMLHLRFWSSGTLLVDRWKILRRSWGGCIHGALSRILVADQVPLLKVTLNCRRLGSCAVVCCRRPLLRWPLVQCQYGKIGERKQVAIVPDAVRSPACECNPPKTPA